MHQNSNWLIILLTLGFLIRLYLAFIPGLVFDMEYWRNWANRLTTVEFSQFYTPNYRTDYTPGYLYVLYLLGLIKNLFHLDLNLFNLILKLPAIIADIILSFCIYKLFRKEFNEKLATIIFSFFLFNPAIIFNSAIWGQIDSMLALILLLFVMYFEKSKILIASLVLGLGVIFKPQTLAILPGLFLMLFRKFNILEIFKILTLVIFVIYILSIPFFPNHPLLGFFNRIKDTANQYSYTSLTAYNFWGVIGYWIDDQTKWQGLSYQIWGIILFATYWLIISALFFSKKLDFTKSFFSFGLTALSLLSFYYLPTRVHERYLFPGLIFLLVYSFLTKSKTLIFFSLMLNLIFFLNLIHVYLKYNGYNILFSRIFFLDKNLLELIYGFLENNTRLFSFLSTAIFLSVTYNIIKLNYVKAKESK